MTNATHLELAKPFAGVSRSGVKARACTHIWTAANTLFVDADGPTVEAALVDAWGVAVGVMLMALRMQW